MIILLFFACIIFIAAIASVYQDKLLFKGFVTVHSSVLSKLIPGRLPITGGSTGTTWIYAYDRGGNILAKEISPNVRIKR